MRSGIYSGLIDRRRERGPFDIIGDVHGCTDELEALLGALGYRLTWHHDREGERTVEVVAPKGRRLVFVGDLVDRGPRSPDALRIAMAATEAGIGFAIPGNHDDKFRRWLAGNKVTISHGLEATIAQMEKESEPFKDKVRAFLEGLPLYLWLDGGALVVAHAGIRADLIGKRSDDVRRFCLYGDTTGERDAYGLPVRLDWARDYTGEALIVYGHTPMREARLLGRTACIDTGCCFGGKLTALRYPELTLVSEPARKRYAEPVRPLAPAKPGLDPRQELSYRKAGP